MICSFLLDCILFCDCRPLPETKLMEVKKLRRIVTWQLLARRVRKIAVNVPSAYCRPALRPAPPDRNLCGRKTIPRCGCRDRNETSCRFRRDMADKVHPSHPQPRPMSL